MISPSTLRSLVNHAANGALSSVAQLLLSLGLGEVFATYAGNPNGNLTPEAVGQWCRDTTNSVWYRSHGVTNTSWAALQAGGSGKLVNCTASTLAITAALHDGKIVTLNRAAGIAVTLPAATGSGMSTEFIVGTTFTGSASIAVADATDYMRGRSLMFNDTDSSMNGWETANTGTLATESDTFTMNGTTLGGRAGDRIRVVDLATDVWHIEANVTASGVEATNWSAAV
jgi:hypothetical protein